MTDLLKTLTILPLLAVSALIVFMGASTLAGVGVLYLVTGW